jgi:hypothetical protein
MMSNKLLCAQPYPSLIHHLILIAVLLKKCRLNVIGDEKGMLYASKIFVILLLCVESAFQIQRRTSAAMHVELQTFQITFSAQDVLFQNGPTRLTQVLTRVIPPVNS